MHFPTHIEAARWLIASAVALALGAASVNDILVRKIPNWTVVAVIALFGAWAISTPSVSLLSSFAASAIIFAITSTLFALGIVGGGDSKLMTAVALFAGFGQLPDFVFLTALAGGAMAVASLASQPMRTFVMLTAPSTAASTRGIPYGVAISLSGIALLVRQLL
ncbi:MAG TPA: prepilin peptidase [Rhizomicrobium sp.]|nr:prepilin peptidase [Rhizomicrobium sp.]